jgi:hypothetical protein
MQIDEHGAVRDQIKTLTNRVNGRINPQAPRTDVWTSKPRTITQVLEDAEKALKSLCQRIADLAGIQHT